MAYRELQDRSLAIASTLGTALSEADLRKTIEIVRQLSNDLRVEVRAAEINRPLRQSGLGEVPIMRSSVFIAASAAVILFLGLLHLLYTFRGPMLHPRDSDLTAKMMTVSPVISQETTMWRVWVGFNATHSFGLIIFGVLYGYLAIRHSAFLFHSWFLLALGFALLLGYAVVARVYFFPAPFRGVVLAAGLYLLGIVVNLARWKSR
jgi:hypothetical protein